MSEEKETYEPSPKAREETPINPARSSIDTVTDAESIRENARRANPNGFTSTSEGVDVKAAEAEFATLQRELSGISQASRKLSRTQSKGVATEKDVEKAASDGSITEEAFDLEHVLRGNHTVSFFLLSRLVVQHVGHLQLQRRKVFGTIPIRLLMFRPDIL